MNLNYKILWLDNDLQGYIDNDSVKSIEDFLLEQGFEPIIEPVFDETDIDIALAKHNYDLIVSDYNLENTTGDTIIKYIREVKRLDTEILFYSANTDYKNNSNVRKNLSFIERVTFHYGRDTLLERIESVISLTLKKLFELNATRGLITAATSDLDAKIEELVMVLISQQDANEIMLNNFVIKKVIEPLQRRLENFWDNYGSFQEYFHKIDAVKKWEIFRELLKMRTEGTDVITLFLKANKSYQDEVISLRNKFAHARAVELDGKMVLTGQYGSEDFEFDEARCIEIRKTLISHKNHMDNLEKFLLRE